MYLTDLGRGFIRQYIISNQTEIKIEEITVRNIIAVNNGGYRRICNNYQLNKKLKLINSNIDTYTYAYADNIDDLGALYVNKSNKIYFGAYGEPCANYVNNYNILYNRVFGDINFKKGGRFFNEISSMPKKRRSNLLIDGKHTVELDFSCLHPRILYHQLGIDEVRDIYTLGIDINGPDFENIRKAHKVAFNILINCSKKDPVKALNNFYYKQSIRKFRDETRTPMKLPEEWSAKQIIDSVKNNHPKLAKYFNKGIGIKLQNLESKIAEKVMLHFATLKRPCLSVHDSFIVWEKDKEELRKIMLEAYKEVVNTEFEAAVM